MTLREFFEIASFCALHPSMLLRNYWGNRKEAQKIDDLIDVLIENKERVRYADSSTIADWCWSLKATSIASGSKTSSTRI